MTWQREDWETRVAADGLHPGAVLTALALAAAADDEGVAVPGLLDLAEASGCSVSTAYQRVVRLLSAGWIERDGKSYVKPGGPLCRYRLVTPDLVDVGQSLPGGGWS